MTEVKVPAQYRVLHALAYASRMTLDQAMEAARLGGFHYDELHPRGTDASGNKLIVMRVVWAKQESKQVTMPAGDEEAVSIARAELVQHAAGATPDPENPTNWR